MICIWHWGIAIVRFHCYEKKHGIHRTSLSPQCENCEFVPPHNNVKSQKPKGHTTKTKERQNNVTAVPTQWKNCKLLNPAMNLLKHGDETAETW